MAAVAIIAAAAILAYLWAFDPSESPAPRCIVKMLTGHDCPGCGSQRAIHALLHGRVAEAWHFNAAIFPGLALAALYARRPKWLRPILFASPTPYIILAAILAWWVLR